MIRLFWILLCCLTGPLAWAQLEHAGRLELPTRPSREELFNVLPLQERGLLLSVRRSEPYRGEFLGRFEFQRYSTNLKPLWTVEYKADDLMQPLMSFHNDEYLFWLMQESGSEKISVLRVNLEDGMVETFDGKMLSLLDVQHFKVLGNTAYIGGYYRSRPVVMAFSFFDRSVRVLQGLYVNNVEISSLEIDALRKEVHVLLYTPRKRCQFSIRSFSPEGRPLRTLDFDGSKYSLISGKILPVSEQESLLIGNYSADCTPYSQGIYVTRIRHNEGGKTNVATDQPEEIRYIEFSELQNFFNYLKPKQQKRLQERMAKRKEEGKDLKFRYRLLVHDLLPTPDGLLLVSEVYYPQYYSSSAPTFGAPFRTSQTEGYRYTHAFICGFDKEGKLLWDNSVAIKNLTNPELQEMVQVSQVGGRQVLAYPQEGEIVTEVIDGSRVIRADEKYKLQTSAEHEKVMLSANENITAWYGNCFLACGFQKIADERNYRGTEREVFYINKLTYKIAPKDSADSARK